MIPLVIARSVGPVRVRLSKVLPPFAPALSVTQTLVERVFTLTASAPGATGFGLVLTLDGDPVTATESGSGDTRTWTYAVAPSFSDLALDWTVTASNGAGESSQSGSVVVPSGVEKIEIPVTSYALTPRDPSILSAETIVVDLTTYDITALAPLVNGRVEIPATPYALTAPVPLITALSIQEVDAQVITTGSGNFSVVITSPAPYTGGPYANDLSAEGSNADLNFDAIGTAPQCIVKPIVVRTAVAPGGSQFKVGDTFTASRGLWAERASSFGTAAQAGQWHLDGSPISGATGLTYVAAAAGALTYVENLTGAGTTRTAVSNSTTIAGVNATTSVPLTSYALTALAPSIDNDWDVVGGAGSLTINAAPNKPAAPVVEGGEEIFTVTG